MKIALSYFAWCNFWGGIYEVVELGLVLLIQQIISLKVFQFNWVQVNRNVVEYLDWYNVLLKKKEIENLYGMCFYASCFMQTFKIYKQKTSSTFLVIFDLAYRKVVVYQKKRFCKPCQINRQSLSLSWFPKGILHENKNRKIKEGSFLTTACFFGNQANIVGHIHQIWLFCHFFFIPIFICLF